MTNQRIKINSIIENQLPQYVRDEFPLVSEFLSQYYLSLETQSGINDILQNIDQYVKIDNLANLNESTNLEADVSLFDTTINVESTIGFPDSYGLILIDSEIITYTSKTEKTFDGCIRGFSGVTSYQQFKDELTFNESEVNEHFSTVNEQPNIVINLSIIFLKEFLSKIKKQFVPGFEERELYSNLNERLFLKQSIDFYTSKGTDNSFKILFGALYGENVDVIKPRDYLIQPSDAQYRVTADLVVESISGNVESLVNKTLYQDSTELNEPAQGTVTKVEKIIRGSKEYYVISLDYDYDKDILPLGTVYGKFRIHPKTRLVVSSKINSETLDVDSTVGFPNKNGNLVVNLQNGNTLNITYSSKTLNQFLDCTGITEEIPESTEINLNVFAYGYDSNDIIKVRILGVLSDLEVPENNYLYSKNDVIKIQTLGANLNDYKSNNWFFNIPSKYKILEIAILDTSDKSYKVITSTEHSFKVGDLVTFLASNSTQYTGRVISYNNETSFNIKFGSEIQNLDVNLNYIAQKNISYPIITNYPSVNRYTSNVQNVYTDDKSLHVCSPSLPNYKGLELTLNTRSVLFSGTFNDDEIINVGFHGFYTGDSVVYIPSENDTSGISTGIYYIKKIDDNRIKLSRSKNNIFTQNYIKITGIVENSKIIFSDFTYRDFTPQVLESQKLIRKLSNPENDSFQYITNPGLTGIFINGVEILNYKSKDSIFYGSIENIIPTSPGEDYDVINPPILSITDEIGSGANGYCSVVGNLKRIDIIDPGFDYLETPKIEIFGGNGKGAESEVNLVSFDHSVDFNSQSNANLVKLNPLNVIGFSSYHKFRDIEEVVYITNGQSSVGGLSTNSSYFASVQDAYSIKLYKSISDATVGINTIQLTSYGVGNHTFKSKDKKKKIGNITIKNQGISYENKLSLISSSGINTSSDTINIKNHGYKSGEIIVYDATESPIGGLSSSFSYYVTKINDDKFKLSSIGINTLGISTSFYYDSKQYINFTDRGTGIHKFNYPQIKVTISGRIGVSTISSQNWNAKIRPIFRGGIQSVFIESGGNGYGSEEILNYNRQPTFNLNSGSGAQLTPIVSDGKITNVLVNSAGTGYNSPPEIKVLGSGTGALLTPIISNGSLIEIKVISGGLGYKKENTSIEIISSGKGAKFEAQIKSWNINLVERLIQNSQITEDDGILSVGLNGDYGLQYSHAYSPRYLRSLVQGTKFKDGKKYYTPDLQLIDKKEIDSTSHSPIIGWAYDGNPIYGPYGYSPKNDGTVKCLESGYKLILDNNSNRPNVSLYPRGFFVEDYIYTGNGDLDEHNGKFGVTPEYPNGIYAYFLTVNPNLIDSSGSFINYKKPVFPYIIGNTYKSKPIEYNFTSNSNQDYIDINATNWRRNTTPYNILKNEIEYDYILNPNSIKSQKSIVKSIFTGSVDNIGIITGGRDYKVGDRINFDSKYGYGAKAKVSLIDGKNVSQISVESSQFDDVKFYPHNGEFVGFTTIPHNLLNNDLIKITGKYDYNKISNIIVNKNVLILTSGINSSAHTGLVTYFNVSGNLDYPNIKENDIYEIGDEQVKILNIDKKSSRIRVIRNQNNTVGVSSHNSGSLLEENTRKFKVNFGITTSYNFKIDSELYFDPKESIGLGTIYGVGIVSSIYFSNPGAGETQISIPTKSIYIKNHNLNTGDLLIYSSNNGSPIGVSTDGINSFILQENSELYATKITEDLIGISTVRVGFGSFGNIVSFASTINTNLLYFTSVGSGNTHSFKTNYDDIFSASISKNTVTVSTAETHGLSLYDNIIVNVEPGISTTFVVKYNDYNRRIVINPRSFSSINLIDSTIKINNHGYYTGQKVIYNSNNPPSELQNEGIYYIVSIDQNTIKLATTYYDSVKSTPKTIKISTSTSGVISPINPPIKILKNQTTIFDLSDSSLSFVNNSILYSAFELKIYKDEFLTNEYESVGISSVYEISKIDRVGIDTTSKIILKLNENFRENIYYNLIPINLELNSDVKKQIIIDDEVIGFNKIILSESSFNGSHKIIGISSNTFKYNISNNPESPSYTNKINYYTNSTTSEGSIKNISIITGGKYSSLPGITSISSKNGKNAILKVETNSIGKIKSTEIEDIGFDYSSDYSIRPIAKLPDILEIETLSLFDYIGITSVGKNYISPPSLVVVDGLTNKIVDDVVLSYSFGDSQVSILRNSNKINNVVPKIIPTNNSNGIKINNISYNSSSKDVIVSLGASFSSIEDFPFSVGDKILIEGTSVGIETIGKGYNSSNYNYSLFTIINIDPNIGGIGATVCYNLSTFLDDGEYPGTFSSVYSFGKIIPESYFPIFNPVLKKGEFYRGELVSNNSSKGIVEFWDPNNGYLKVDTIDKFYIGNTIIGNTSGSVGIIKNIISNNANYKIDSFSERRKGWNSETGFLNNDLQRIHDSDYYQYFSYEIKSKKDFNTWNNAVSNLNHTAGFKKFANLIIESEPINVGLSTLQNKGDFTGIVDYSNTINLNCVSDFDLAKENNLIIDDKIKSNEIIFNSSIIQDYIESIGNRVLIIDDISNQFNSNPRSTEYSITDTFLLSDFRSKKYIATIIDKTNSNKKQVSSVTLIYDNVNGFLNQYGLTTVENLGSFDFNISGNVGNLLFYPINSKFNDYHIELFAFSLNDVTSGIGTINFGNSSKLHTNSIIIPKGTTAPFTIVGIASTYRSSKVLVQIGSTDFSYYEYQELTYIHDNNQVYVLEYGQINTNTLTSTYSSGIGTYNAYISGSNVLIDLIPNIETDVDYVVNTFNVSLATTSFTGIGTQLLSSSKIQSSSLSIASSTSPVPTPIYTYSNSIYDGSYFIIQVEDTQNNNYQVSEILLTSDSSDSYITEYGIIYNSNNLGLITSGKSGTNNILYFTPIENINVDIKVLSLNVGLNLNSSEITLVNGSINYDYGDYVGTNNDVKKSFNLTHKNLPIFERYFNSENSNVVNINSNTIKIPNNFYVTGEEIIYSYPNDELNRPIGIATTSIPGIGVTDKLPSSLYVVKVDDLNIKVAVSASDALKTIPNVLDLTTVGIGSYHKFVSKNQNKKCLISIDNIIQSPIVSTSTTCKLVSDLSLFDSQIYVTGIGSIYGGDLIKIDDEIMKVTSVGVGSTNSINIIRTYLGTGISTHSSSSLVTKIYGNYNIVNNTIYFADPPYGNVVNPGNKPDEIDYVGISSSSSFNGRVFLRSGETDGIKETYYDNFIFDDLSDKFDGSKKTFTLKSNGSNISGISSDNIILLINEVFQIPSSLTIVNDYNLLENSGITSITFTGNGTSVDYDVNTASIPRGGIILSIGSTPGFGYQPLVCAGGSAIVSSAGTIQSISIGNSGSGYRSGIQTNIRVGIKTENIISSYIEFVGIASAKNGNIVSVAITNPGIGYTNYSILKSTKTSENISSGSSVISLVDTNNIVVGNYISVGTALTNVYIVGVGTTAVTIGVGDTISGSISSATTSIVKYYNPPIVIFDDPLSYYNLPLVYSSESSLGIGSGATIDIVVGQGSSIISFDIKNLGYGYKPNEILTVSVGGTTGIQTISSGPFSEFRVLVDRTFSDTFSAWSVGNLQVIDPLDSLFDGTRKAFPILIDGNQTTIRSKKGSNIDVASTLLIFINDVLQVPNEGYIFNGGSTIQFTESPKEGDKSRILFYRGTSEVDTIVVDILETIKIGDKVVLKSDDINLNQDERIVEEILSSDILKTNLYSGEGISSDLDILRPVTWCRQTEDLFINGQFVSKDRIAYEPYIQPITNIIQNVSTSSTQIFVESVKTFFDSEREYFHNGLNEKPQNKIIIISQDEMITATAIANVSTSGTISSITVTNGGIGYVSQPSISISNPIGVGTTGLAEATATITNGYVSTINVDNGGFGYSSTQSPIVLIETPKTNTEIIDKVTYSGDFGIITGINSISVGVASTGIVFDFFIPKDSILRDTNITKVGLATTGISGIQTGYYFVVKNSNLGNGIVSLDSNRNIVGIGSTFIDNIYQVASVSIAQTSVPGVGLTNVAKVVVSISNYNGMSGFGFSNFYGEYSWGIITNLSRKNPKQFISYANNSGISTSPVVQRYNRLKYIGYSTS